MQTKCVCNDLCDQVTQEELADLSPFTVETCNVSAGTEGSESDIPFCAASCTSPGLAKNVKKLKSCLEYPSVVALKVQLPRFPRCDVDCNACPNLHWGSFCEACPAGSAGIGNICPKCPPGSSAGRSGMHQCDICPMGKFSRSIGSTQCLDCPAGTYSNLVGANTCISCGSGYANPERGSVDPSACEICEPGRYSEKNSSALCERCPSGSWYDKAGSSSLNNCIDCKRCGEPAVLHLCRTPRDASCEFCPQGFVKLSLSGGSLEDALPCEYCPLGHFPSVNGDKCLSFQMGNSFEMLEVNAFKRCYHRSLYDGMTCPTLPNGGWGTVGKPANNASVQYEDLPQKLLFACSAMHCVGVLQLAIDIYKTRVVGDCSTDLKMRELCAWTTYQVNAEVDRLEQRSASTGVRKIYPRCAASCSECADNRWYSNLCPEDFTTSWSFGFCPLLLCLLLLVLMVLFTA